MVLLVFVFQYGGMLPFSYSHSKVAENKSNQEQSSQKLRVSVRHVENHTSYPLEENLIKGAKLSLMNASHLNFADNPKDSQAYLDVSLEKIIAAEKNTQVFMLVRFKLFDADGKLITETEITESQSKLAKDMTSSDTKNLLLNETLSACVEKGVEHLGVLVANVGEVSFPPSNGKLFVKFMYPQEVKTHSKVEIECKDKGDAVCAEGTVESTGLEHSVIKLAKLDASVKMGDSVHIVSNPNPAAQYSAKKAKNSFMTTGIALLGVLGIAALLGSKKKESAAATVSTATGATTASSISLTVSPTTLTADGTSTATVTATVKDSNNAAVADGTSVSFQSTGGTVLISGGGSVGKTVNGVAAATLRSPVTAGTATVTAASGAATSNSVTVTFTAPSTQAAFLSSIELSTIVVQANDQSGTTLAIDSTQGTAQTTIKAVAKDSTGTKLNNVPLTFVSTLGNITSPVTTATVAGEDGVARSSFSTTKSGNATITVTSGSISSTLVLKVNPGTPKQVVVAAAPPSILADANSSSTLTVTVTDVSGNPVADGTLVNFSVTADVNTGGNGSITPSSLTTNGIATAVLTSRDPTNATPPYTASRSGTATVVVTVPSTGITNSATKVVFVSKVAQYIALAPALRNIRGLDFVGGQVAITALVYDVNRNQVADGTTVYFTTNHGMIIGGGTTGTGITSAITTGGSATVTLYTAASDNETEICNPASGVYVGNGTKAPQGVVTGTFWNWCGLVTFRAYSGNASDTSTTIFSGPANTNRSTLTTTPAAVANLRSTGDALTVTVVAKDINGYPVVDGTAVTLVSSKAQLDATSGGTVGGVFTTTLRTAPTGTTNPTASGLGTITATVDTGGYGPVVMTVTFNVL